MNRPPCTKMSSCVRREGHRGCCTACPSSATLGWDDERVADDLLRDLDFPAPKWADLLDEGEAA